MRRKPITIPKEISRDRAVRRLITSWMHIHARYIECTKRVNWKNAAARKIEKRRRKEKWMCVARILEIERTLIRWTAKATHHRDIWMSKKPDASPSLVYDLEQTYYQNRRLFHGAGGAKRQKAMHAQEMIVSQLRTIRREWMVAIFTSVYPTKRPPAPIAMHPRELVPRKITDASKILSKELEAHAA